MAVAIDTVGTEGGTGSYVETISSVGTVGSGTNRAIVCQLIFDIASVTGVSVVWDPEDANEAMSLIGKTSDDCLQFWGLVNPTTGSGKNVTATWTNTKSCAISNVSFTGVNQSGGTSSFTYEAEVTGNSTTPSITVTTANGNATMDVGLNTAAPFASPTQTQTLANNSMPINYVGGSVGLAAAATNVHSWTLAGSGAWREAGANIIAAAAAIDGTVSAVFNVTP